MKGLTFFILFSFAPLLLLSQSKYDYVWTLGYGDTLTVPSNGISVGGITMDFNTEPPTLTRIPFLCSPTACISDQNGRLLAYTNGCSIYNREHKEMLNGDDINSGKVHKEFCGYNSAWYPVRQGNLFLPMPGKHDSVFCLLHLRSDDKNWDPEDVLLTTIDVHLDNGLGGVIKKNELVFKDKDTLISIYLTATRHANGRDWWVLAPRSYPPEFHLFLLDPSGIHYQGTQTLGDSAKYVFAAHTCFSADGSKFIKNWGSGLYVYDFDRCSGQLSNPIHLPYDSTYIGGGVVTSPNSRFLYLFNFTQIWQYDFWATDFEGSRQTVAVYDGFLSPFETGFFQPMVAPNGKIYSISSSTNNILHVIHHPDEPGLACGVEPHGVILPALTAYIMPNMTNYRLGALAGSPCDSLTVSSAEPQPHRYEPAGLDVYPNPATEEVNFEQLSAYAGLGGRLTLSDVTGRVVAAAAFQPGEPVLRLDVRGLARGMYVWSYVRADGRRATGKIVKSEK